MWRSLLRSRSLSRHATLVGRSVAWRDKERLRRRLLVTWSWSRWCLTVAFVLDITFWLSFSGFLAVFSPQKNCVKIKVFNLPSTFPVMLYLLVVIYVVDSGILLVNHRQHWISSTVPLKGKLTVSTQSSKLNSRIVKVETFEFRDTRVEDRELRVESQGSRIAKWRVLEYSWAWNLAIHVSRKEQWPFAHNNQLFVDVQSKQTSNVAVWCLKCSQREK